MYKYMQIYINKNIASLVFSQKLGLSLLFSYAQIFKHEAIFRFPQLVQWLPGFIKLDI